MDLDNQQQAKAVHPVIAGHLASVKLDLSQVQKLLRDAVDNLLTDAFAIREACRNQSQVAAGESGSQREADVLTASIDQCAGSMLRHLQFQDMVSQLLDHVRISIDAAEALALSGSTEPQCGKEAESSPESRVVKGKPVQSSDMSAGDIDLF